MPFQPNQTGSFFLILVDSPIEIHQVHDLFQRDSLKREIRKFMIFGQSVGDLSKLILPVAWKLTSLGSITCMSDFVKPLSSWLAMMFDKLLGLVFSRMCFEQMRQNKQLQCHLYIETLSTVYTGNLCNSWNALSLEFAVQRNTFLSELQFRQITVSIWFWHFEQQNTIQSFLFLNRIAIFHTEKSFITVMKFPTWWNENWIVM